LLFVSFRKIVKFAIAIPPRNEFIGYISDGTAGAGADRHCYVVAEFLTDAVIELNNLRVNIGKSLLVFRMF